MKKSNSLKAVFAMIIVAMLVLACNASNVPFLAPTATATITSTPTVTPSPTRTPTATPIPDPSVSEYWNVPTRLKGCATISPEDEERVIVEVKNCKFELAESKDLIYITYVKWADKSGSKLFFGPNAEEQDVWGPENGFHGIYYFIKAEGFLSLTYAVSNSTFSVTIESATMTKEEIMDWAEKNILKPGKGFSST